MPPPATISGPSRAAQELGGARQLLGLGDGPADAPDALVEQLLGPVEGLGLHVLRERERHRAGLGGVGQHAHRAQQRRRELLGALDPVPVARDRLERVVDATRRRTSGPRVPAAPSPDARVAKTSPGSSSTGRRLIVASAAPVTMFVAPGPDRGRAGQRGEAVLLPRVADRGVDHRPARCGPGRRASARSARAAPARRRRRCRARRSRSSPAISRCSTPSRSLYWIGQEPHQRLGDRQSHGVLLVIGSLRSSSCSAQRVADPGVRGVVREAPRALAGAGHHVQVVEVVAGGGHRRSVVAVRHHDEVSRADLLRDVDLAPGAGAVHALVAEAVLGDLEVVDLLEHGLLARDVLVVLVRRVAGPVAAGGEHLDGDQAVGLEGLGRAEVVDLAAGLARAAQLDGDVLRPRRGGPRGGGRPWRRAGRTGRRVPRRSPHGRRGARTRSR